VYKGACGITLKDQPDGKGPPQKRELNADVAVHGSWGTTTLLDTRTTVQVS